MRVVSKAKIFDRILEGISKVLADNRVVDYIMVTPEECQSLCEDARVNYMMDYSFCSNEVTIKTKEFKNSSGAIVKAFTRFAVNGYDLYVVPEGFNPL